MEQILQVIVSLYHVHNFRGFSSIDSANTSSKKAFRGCLTKDAAATTSAVSSGDRIATKSCLNAFYCISQVSVALLPLAVQHRTTSEVSRGLYYVDIYIFRDSFIVFNYY